MAGLSQADVVAATGLSMPTVKRAESDRNVSVSADALSLIRHALEASGVIFVEENGEGPGVRLRKEIADKGTLDGVAKQLAHEFTEYCKKNNSLAFASASGVHILVQCRAFDLTTMNLMSIEVTSEGFSIDAKTLDRETGLTYVYEMLNSKRI